MSKGGWEISQTKAESMYISINFKSLKVKWFLIAGLADQLKASGEGNKAEGAAPREPEGCRNWRRELPLHLGACGRVWAGARRSPWQCRCGASRFQPIRPTPQPTQLGGVLEEKESFTFQSFVQPAARRRFHKELSLWPGGQCFMDHIACQMGMLVGRQSPLCKETGRCLSGDTDLQVRVSVLLEFK